MTEYNDEFDRSLTERLRAYEARVPGAAVPSLAAIGSGASRRPRTAWGVGALVATGGVAAGLILVLILSGRPAPPTGEATATPQPTSSASETPVPSASTVPSPPLLSVIPIAGLTAEDDIRAIIEVDGRLIGVGRQGDQGAVWTSLDGASWTLAPDLPVTKPIETSGTTMTSVVPGPGGLVAFGSWTSIDFGTPRIWYSADGQQWTSVYGPSDPDPAVDEPIGFGSAVTAGGPGYVAVGTGFDDGFTVRPQVWTSADGRDWTAVDSQGITGSLSDVVGGAGMLVAVGSGAFVSNDGATWTAAPEQEALLGAEMTSVAFRNGAFVATGLLTGPGDTFPSTPAIWHSPDGLHWSLALQGESGQRISQIVSADAGFVAIGGYFPSAGWSYDAADPIPPSDTLQLWFSAYGETWSGPTTGFVADGGISTLGQATVWGGNLFVPVTLLNPGPDFPVSQPAILRGPLPLS